MSPSATPHMVELPNSVHQLPTGSKAMRRTNGQRWIELTLGVKRSADLPDLSDLDNKLPKARNYMTRDQLESKYGSDPKAIKSIEDFAKAHKLVVTRNEPAAARLGIAGTVDDVSDAFGVTLFDYSHPSLGDFHARTGPVHVPTEVGDAITGVFGLNNHRVLRRSRHSAQSAKPDFASSVRHWFVPTELGAIYKFPQVDASKQCIGLLEFGGGVETPDVAAYFSKIGVPAPEVAVIAVDGVSTDPAGDPDSTGEVMLDVDVAGALGGGAKIATYFSTFDEKGLVDCLAKVVSDSVNDPSVVSISWGWDENQAFNNAGVIWSPAAIDHCNHSFLAAAHLGITFCVSTGDDGSEAQMQDGRAHVNFPATSPYVLAVGGTTFACAREREEAGADHRNRLERRTGKRHRRRRQRHHAGSELAERHRAEVDQSRALCRTRDPGRCGQRRSGNGLSDDVGRQARHRRRHQRVRTALGQPDRPDQRRQRRTVRQFQRPALFQVRPGRRAARHHRRQQ